MPVKLKKVAVLVESTRAYGRELIRGIGLYNHEHRRWQIEYHPRGLSEPVPDWIKDWQGDGILARINNVKLFRLLRRIGIPVIDLRRSFSSAAIPQIGPDDKATVSMLFEYFRRLGFRNFGFIGLPWNEHAAMDVRRDHCRQLVEDHELPFSELEISLSEFECNGSRSERRLIRWLQRLPKRTAIIASNDDLGLQILNACRTAGLSVPNDFAVTGIGNDDCLCELAEPTLTSVDLNPLQIGYAAAEMLDQMMNRKFVPPPSTLVKPYRIVARRSTNTVATDDAVVASALKLIRNRACDGLTVKEVLQQARISRAALEIRFKETLGHTVFQEILAVRLERVRELLLTTTLTIKEIARETGFRYQGYLMRVFQRRIGRTMKEYRLQLQESCKVKK